MPTFKTIRQTAALGILPEHRLWTMREQKILPGIQTGTRFMVNVDALVTMLDSESGKNMDGVSKGSSDNARFGALRRKVADMIRSALAEDAYCKSYEGSWEVATEYRDYFEDETASLPPKLYRLTLHCYVLGPARHYDWTGKTFSEALDKAEREIMGWAQDYADLQ